MLTGIEIEGFRGFKHARIDGLGRVNLFIGKNDCGKTTSLEVATVLWNPQSAANVLFAAQNNLRHRLFSTPERNLGVFFRNGELDRPFRIEGSDTELGEISVAVRAERLPDVFSFAPTAFRPGSGSVANVAISGGVTGATGPGQQLPAGPSWKMVTAAQIGGMPAAGSEAFLFPGGGVQTPPLVADLSKSQGMWIYPGPNVSVFDIRHFSLLRGAGDAGKVVETLRALDDSIVDLEILAPDGANAEVFVRLSPGPAVPVPLQTLGEGVQRGFELAVAVHSPMVRSLCIDEFENGFHHSAHERLWGLLASATKARAIQIFATTHSHECLMAAHRAFEAQGDDGLRVIRLDRHEGETRAAVYNLELLGEALASGSEIRG